MTVQGEGELLGATRPMTQMPPTSTRTGRPRRSGSRLRIRDAAEFAVAEQGGHHRVDEDDHVLGEDMRSVGVVSGAYARTRISSHAP